jgi:NADH:ubiquinone reductase (non-electrogenic)
MLNDWRISKHGVQIATNSVIEKVDSTDLYLKGQGAVPYGILLWVTGNKSLPFVDRLDVKKSTTGLVRILTDPSLRVKKKGNLEGQVFLEVFALGDAADIEGQSLPTTAEVAVQKPATLSIN